MINDIDDNMKYASILSFADDNRLWNPITSQGDCSNSEDDLEKVYTCMGQRK